MVRRHGQRSAEAKRSTSQAAMHEVVFWGVRGTIPSIGATTAKYGGNTSCVEVCCVGQDGERSSLVLDAGSGIVDYGAWALSAGIRSFNIMLSHVHYDHIIGLTRFVPIFRPDCSISFYGGASCGLEVRDIIERFFAHPFFPVAFRDLGAKLEFHTVSEGDKLDFGGLSASFLRLNHPNGALASRVFCEETGSSVVYCTDHEHGSETDQRIVAFAQDASLMVYDATFSDAQYQLSRGWGHSTPAKGARIASEAGVRALGLFHHEPNSSDGDLDSIHLPEASAVFPESFVSREGFSVDLGYLHNSFDSSRGDRIADVQKLATL